MLFDIKLYIVKGAMQKLCYLNKSGLFFGHHVWRKTQVTNRPKENQLETGIT